MDKVIREFTEIELHPNNMHRENGFSLSMSWKPLILPWRNRQRLCPRTRLALPLDLTYIGLLFPPLSIHPANHQPTNQKAN
jgi:hypothetical protein